jgi:hypothetical protein
VAPLIGRSGPPRGRRNRRVNRHGNRGVGRCQNGAGGAAEQARMILVRTLCVVTLATAVSAVPAAAQFGGSFDPPRPPANVPSRPPLQAAPAQPLQPQSLQPQSLPSQPGQSPPGRSGIESADLPPLTAPAALPLPSAPQSQPPAATANGVRPPRGAPAATDAPATPVPANPAVSPPGAAAPADVVTLPPAQKIVNPTAMFSGLDKITGRITAFDASIGETVQFGALRVTARACYSRPPTETPLTDGFVEVDEVTLQGEVRRIFTGWMFAASPGLHAVEHPIYDVWLTGCKGAAVADAQPAPAAAPALAPARPTASQRQAAPRTPQQNAPNGRSPQPTGTLLAPGIGR